MCIQVQPPGPGTPDKELVVVVTPFKKSCRQDDSYYRKCPGSDRCIKNELFCDGLVNCDGEPKDEQDEFCLVNSSLNNVDMFLSIPIIILIVIFALLGLMFIIFMIRFFLVAMRTAKRTGAEVQGEAERLRPLAASSPALAPAPPPASAPVPAPAPALPPHPPSYSEVVAAEFKDDPPKYSEIPQESHTVICKNC